MKKYYHNVLHGTKTEIYKQPLKDRIKSISGTYGPTVAVIAFFVGLACVAFLS